MLLKGNVDLSPPDLLSDMAIAKKGLGIQHCQTEIEDAATSNRLELLLEALLR